MEDFKLIPLTGNNGEGRFVKVDREDYPELAKYRWQADKDGYACRFTTNGSRRKRVKVSLHREITSAPAGVPVDHISGDVTDCRKSNLRLCTTAQNGYNRTTSQGGTSEFKGVYHSKGAWRAMIKINGKKRHIGRFSSERDAAMAYDACARHYFGDFARTNFVGSEKQSVEHYRDLAKAKQASKYKGVTRNSRGGWVVRLYHDGGKCLYGGYFQSETDAAKRYDELARQILGDEAKLNFPHGA